MKIKVVVVDLGLVFGLNQAKKDKIMYQNYLHLIANFSVTVSNILSKEIISNNTKHRKQILQFH